MEIRFATAEEHAAALRCYERNGYTGGIRPEDEVLIAEADGEVVGAVRLVIEHGFRCLRGMFIDEDRRGQALGTRMLATLVEGIGSDDCWLVCSLHLPPFYAQIGFEPVPDEAAPAHLAERADHYRAVYGRQTIMRRPPRGHAGTV